MPRAIKITRIFDNLIFGSTGSLGSGFCEYLSSQRNRGKGSHTTSFSEFFIPRSSFDRALFNVLTTNKVENIFYFAGHSCVKSMNEETSVEELSTLKTSINFINKLQGVKRFVYASSVLAACPQKYLASQEDERFKRSLSLYAKTKLEAESLVRNNVEGNSLSNIFVNRYTNVFGAHPYGTNSLFSYIFSALNSRASVINFTASKHSSFNFVYDRAVHARLYNRICSPALNSGRSVSLNYIVASKCKKLTDLVGAIESSLHPINIRVSYGSALTFWDFFDSASPSISPSEEENSLGFRRMCRNSISPSLIPNTWTFEN